ncbi:MAG: large repetitive protein [Chthoniobacter sp.]|nr:large repetitive protein [Chthoniobacter sp.]
MQDRPRTNSADESQEPPTLVALGTARQLVGKETDKGDRIFQLEIEDVLFGQHSAKSVQFSCRWKPEGRFIFHLVPASSEEGAVYCLRFNMDAEELQAARALCAARLETLTLAADSIFVGEEVDRPDFSLRKIKVLRRISGREFRKNEKLRIVSDSEVASNLSPRARAGPRLYFIGGQYKRQPGEPTIYAGRSVLPTKLEPAVREALTRRGAYPITDAPRWMRDSKIREILFRGSVKEAIGLLSAKEAAARVLGQRFLFHHADEGSAALGKEIAALMFRSDPATAREFVTQKVWIETLGQLERASPTGVLAALAGNLITQIENAGGPVPMPARDEKNVTVWTPGGNERIPEERTTDVNHSLTWLISEMEDVEIARTVEQPLLTMRDHLEGWWRKEVELAIETSDVEQSRFLREALRRMEGVRPTRSATGLRLGHANSTIAVAVSPDGAYLATGGLETRVWSLADWSCVGTVPCSASQIAFSPDSTSLYIKDLEQWSDILLRRYDWRTGRLERSYRSDNTDIAHLELSRDGRVMMTTTYGVHTLILWEMATGRKIRTELMPQVSWTGALRADGKRIARVPHHDDPYPTVSEALVETVTGKGKPLRLHFDFPVARHAFTADGRYLLSIGSVHSPEDFLKDLLRIDAYDFTTGQSQSVVSKTPTHFPSNVAVSPGGHYVAIADEEARVSIYETPGLKLIWETQFQDNSSVRRMAFTPDDQIFVAAGIRPTPYLLRMEKFEEMVPYPGHPAETMAAYFASDSRRLWSIGEDGSICHWDAATMKMIERFPPPKGFLPASIREPDGKYAIFIDGGRRLLGASPSRAVVVDLETGVEIARMDVGLDWGGIYWCSSDEILAISRGFNDEALMRVNIFTGKVLARMPLKSGGGPRFLAKDRRSLLVLRYGDDPERLDFETGALTHPTVSGEGNSRVANGETYERLESSPTPKKLPPIKRYEFFPVLSADGRRLAVVSSGRRDAREKLGTIDTSTPTFIRIHDATTLEMLCAFRASTPKVGVRFNADGTQLAVTNDDGTIERWVLPQ